MNRIPPKPTRAQLASLAPLVDAIDYSRVPIDMAPRRIVSEADYWRRRWKQERVQRMRLSERLVGYSTVNAGLLALAAVLAWIARKG